MGGLLSCNQLAHIEEFTGSALASSGKPSYSYGRASTVTVGTWLDGGNNIPSNETGIPFGLNNGALAELWIGNKNLVEYDISVYHHLGDEVGLTLLTTVTVPAAARTKVFKIIDFGVVSIPIGVQLAVQVTAVPGSNPRSIAVHATVLGSV